ncbi:MAG: hypothetical protein GY719_03610 [bacterium]|nr:hypothetical protein [bacterium]
MHEQDPFKQLSSEGVLSRTFQIYLGHFEAMMGIAFVTMAPVTVFQLILERLLVTYGRGDEVVMITLAVLYPLAMLALTLVAHSLAEGATAFAVAESFLGRKVRFGPSLEYALSRFGALLETNVSIVVRIIGGLLLFIVPGFVWAVAYSIAIPVLVTEGVKPRQALQRTWSLAKGHKWKIFGILLALGALHAALLGGLSLTTGAVLSVRSSFGLLVQQMAIGLVSVAVTPLYLIAATLLYYDARMGSERFGIQELARAFGGTAARERPRPEHELVATPLVRGFWRAVLAPQKVVDCGDYAARMSWRSATYILGEHAVHFLIEPMSAGPDLVYVPDEESWRQSAPGWAQVHRSDIVACLRAVKWNRGLEWREGRGHRVWHSPAGETRVVDGSLEASTSGRLLEGQGLFHPGQRMTPAEAREAWNDALRKYLSQAGGQIQIDLNQVAPGSVLKDVALPLLQRNPRVDLDLGNAPSSEVGSALPSAQHPARPRAPAPPGATVPGAAVPASPAAPRPAAPRPAAPRPDEQVTADPVFEQDDLVEFARAVRESTLERLRAVPQGSENWRVSPGAMSFAELAQHLVETDDWMQAKMNDPDLEPILGQAGTVTVTDREQYLALVEALVRTGQRRERLLVSLDSDALQTRIHDARFGGEVSRWWIIVRGNLDHEIHHRGQIATYLRVLEDGEARYSK